MKKAAQLRRDYRMPSDTSEATLELVVTLAVDDSFFPAFRAGATGGPSGKTRTRRETFWRALRFAMRTQLPLRVDADRGRDVLDSIGRVIALPRRSELRDVHPLPDTTPEEIRVANSLDVDDDFFVAFSFDSSSALSPSAASSSSS